MAIQQDEHKHSTIFRKIFSRLFLAGILPLLAITGAGVTLLYFSYTESNERLEQTLLAQKRSEVDRFIRQTLETFEIFVGYDADESISQQDQDFLLDGILRSNNELRDVSFIATLGGNDGRGIETARLVRGTTMFTLRSRKDDAAYLIASQGHAYISGVTWDNAVAYVTIASPVRNKNGTIVAVLSGELKLTRLQQLFQAASFGNGGTILLLDETGHVLAHSQDASLLNHDAASLPVREEPFRAILTKKGLSAGEVLASSLPLANPRWLFVAEWPVKDAFAPLISFILQIALVGILLIITLLVLATVQAREVVRPIRALQQFAQRIGRGEFWKPVQIRTRDELEELGESLTRMANDLARLQEVRSTEVRAQALAQAIEKEHELDEAKDVLLTTASHQFRTPVSVLNWNISLLKNMNLPKEAQDLVGGISEHTANLSMIASDLLNATAFGAGYVAQPGPEPLALGLLLDEAMKRYRQDAEKKALTITREYPELPTAVQGSYGALRILFEALVSNAITYTPQGGSIQAVVQDMQDGTVGVMLRDSGIGIPEKEQEYLFTAFFRASNAIVAKNVGTGLGLFVARNIAVGHGGTIRFASQEGKGSEFIIILPKQLPNIKKQDIDNN